MNETNDLNVWQNDAPVITITPEQEFVVWQNDSPVMDISEGFIITTTTRRRVFEF